MRSISSTLKPSIERKTSSILRRNGKISFIWFANTCYKCNMLYHPKLTKRKILKKGFSIFINSENPNRTLIGFCFKNRRLETQFLSAIDDEKQNFSRVIKRK